MYGTRGKEYGSYEKSTAPEAVQRRLAGIHHLPDGNISQNGGFCTDFVGFCRCERDFPLPELLRLGIELIPDDTGLAAHLQVSGGLGVLNIQTAEEGMLVQGAAISMLLVFE